MKHLNFAPYYEPYLRADQKTTTLRFHNRQDIRPGETVVLTIGWHSSDAKELGYAKVDAVYRKPVHALDMRDLAGESPDCRTPEAARLVLSCMYRRVVEADDPVFVIQFERSDV